MGAFSSSSFGAAVKKAYNKLKSDIELGLVAVGRELSQNEIITALENWIETNVQALGLHKYPNIGEKPYVNINGISKQVVDGVTFTVPSSPKDKGMQIVPSLESVTSPDSEVWYKLVEDTDAYPRGVYEYTDGWHRLATDILPCKVKFIQDYLGECEYDHNKIDYAFANRYFKKKFGIGVLGATSGTSSRGRVAGACTSIRNGNFYGRNYDWYYDDMADFIIHTNHTGNKYQSIGVAGASHIDNELLKDLKYSGLYDILPFLTVDGINENGVVCNINIVPNDKGITRQTTLGKEDMCTLMIPRYILDNFDNATDAVNSLLNFNFYGVPDNEIHIMVADSTKTYVVEFINNVTTIMEKNYMTNFHLDGVDTKVIEGVTQLDWDTVEPHGMGLERYEKIMREYSTTSDKAGMMAMLQALNYSNAYKDETTPFWKTEFTGETESHGDITIHSTDAEFAPVIAIAKENYENRSRDKSSPYYAKSWQTTHSVVYDIQNKIMYLLVQEEASINEKTYTLNAEEGFVAGDNVEITGNVISSMPILEVAVLPSIMNQKYLYKVIGVNSIVWWNGTDVVDITAESGMIEVENSLPTGTLIKASMLYKLKNDQTHQEPIPDTDPIEYKTVVDYYAGVYARIGNEWKALWSRQATVSYNNVTEKPKMNGVVVDGEHSSEDYDIPTKETVEAEYQKKELSASITGITADTVEGAIEELNTKVGVTFKPKGNVDYESELPTNASNGDVYIVRYIEKADEPGTYEELFASRWWNDDNSKWEIFGSAIDMSAYQKLEDKMDKVKLANPTISFWEGSKCCVNDRFTVLKMEGTLGTPVADIQSTDRAIMTIPPEAGVTDGEVMVRIETHEGQFTANENLPDLQAIDHRYSDMVYSIKEENVVHLNINGEDKIGVEQDFGRNNGVGDLYWTDATHTTPVIKLKLEQKFVTPSTPITIYVLKTNPEPVIIGNHQETITDWKGNSKTIDIPIWEVEEVVLTADENYMKMCDYADSGLNINESGVYGHYYITESALSVKHSIHSISYGKRHGFAGTVEFVPDDNSVKTEFLNRAYVKTVGGVQKLYVQGDVTIQGFFIHSMG